MEDRGGWIERSGGKRKQECRAIDSDKKGVWHRIVLPRGVWHLVGAKKVPLRCLIQEMEDRKIRTSYRFYNCFCF